MRLSTVLFLLSGSIILFLFIRREIRSLIRIFNEELALYLNEEIERSLLKTLDVTAKDSQEQKPIH